MTIPTKRLWMIGAGLALGFMITVKAYGAAPLDAVDAQGRQLVISQCSGCHQEVSKGHLFRIDDVRKTPEGWEMTIFRMEHLHGVKLTPQQYRDILAYLADTQGLSPSETAGYRYVLEQRPDAIDKVPDPELKTMCGRCHSNARYALQRRDEADWLRNINFHVAEWPSLEYQNGSRGIYWWKIATTQMPGKLAKLFPLQSAAWTKWSSESHPSLAGEWRIIAWQPGKGLFDGEATYKALGDHEYQGSYHVTGPGGAKRAGDGKAIVYTGYEWRGDLLLGKQDLHEVYAASEDGRTMTGRWFDPAHSEIGANVTLVKMEAGETRILAANPSYAKAGSSAEVTLIGFGLSGKPNFGPGITVKVLSTGPDRMTLKLAVDPHAKIGAHDIRLGTVDTKGLFTVYDHVDSVRVTPAYAVARLGGGHVSPVTAQFEAVGYMNGPDGKPGTADDIRIGVMPANFKALPYDAGAARLHDTEFAGTLTKGGLFLPAVAGPDPRRQFSTDNGGNLAIKATVKDGDRHVSGAAHLIVTVQRWNTPPIR